MFDVSFTELMLIGVVALVVIGPERLPKVARTAGHLLGRAQRYVSDVKSDIQREIDLEEVNKLKKQMDDAAQSLKASMNETASSLQQPLTEARDSLAQASASVDELMQQARSEIGDAPAAHADATPAAATAPIPATTPADTAPAEDRNTAQQPGAPT